MILTYDTIKNSIGELQANIFSSVFGQQQDMKEEDWVSLSEIRLSGQEFDLEYLAEFLLSVIGYDYFLAKISSAYYEYLNILGAEKNKLESQIVPIWNKFRSKEISWSEYCSLRSPMYNTYNTSVADRWRDYRHVMAGALYQCSAFTVSIHPFLANE